jgi:hypothetical protein
VRSSARATKQRRGRRAPVVPDVQGGINAFGGIARCFAAVESYLAENKT